MLRGVLKKSSCHWIESQHEVIDRHESIASLGIWFAVLYYFGSQTGKVNFQRALGEIETEDLMVEVK